MNSGDRGGLWKLFEDEIRSNGSRIPLLKIWCSAHRAELAWKAMTNHVLEISKLLRTLNAIASYIHFFSVRARDLEKIASENQLGVMKIPKLFNIRWSEYTHNVIRSIIVSWKALILFFPSKLKRWSGDWIFGLLNQI